MTKDGGPSSNPLSLKFTYKEVVEALIKTKGIQKGIWSLGFEVSMKAGQVNEDKSSNKHPTIFNIITGITLSRVAEENNLSVNADKMGSRIKLIH